jgi:hypothetical protein
MTDHIRGLFSKTELDLICLVVTEVNISLDVMLARKCGHDTVIVGDGKPKMTWEAKCTQTRGHLGDHYNGAEYWKD